MFLSDSQWLLLQPLFPPSKRGRPSMPGRVILELIFQKFTRAIPWYALPTASPSWQTCYYHYRLWQRSGIWKTMLAILIQDLSNRGGFDLLSSIERKDISIRRLSSRQLEITYPPSLESAWQRSTASLIIYLLFSVL